MDEDLVIPLAAIGLPLLLVPMIIVLVQAQRRREWAHKERMRAMDLGLAPPTSAASTFWPSLAALAIGAGVPASAFLFCFLTSAVVGGDDHWAAAAVVGFVSVICGSVMVGRILSGKQEAESPAEALAEKPAVYDPDAYDTVGRRG